MRISYRGKFSVSTECYQRHTLPRSYAKQPVDLIDRCAISWRSYHGSRGARHNTFGQLSRVSIGKFSVSKENGKYDERYHTASTIRLGGSLILSVNVCLSIVLPNHPIKSSQARKFSWSSRRTVSTHASYHVSGQGVSPISIMRLH